MFNPLITSPKLSPQRLPYWLLTAIVAVLIPLFTNGLLPLIGLNQIAERIGPDTIPTLLCGILGCLLYVGYIQYVTKHPLVMTVYLAVFIWVVFYLGFLGEQAGQHLPVRVLHIPLLYFPTVLLLIQNFKYLYRNYNYFKYTFLFLCAFLIFFFTHNLNFVEPIMALSSGASISQVKLNDFFFTFVGFVFVACTFKQAKTSEERFKLFRMINTYLAIFALIQSACTLVGYPFNLFTSVVEGFKRATGFNFHPNEYAKTAGILIIYFIGVFYSYCRNGSKTLLKDRMLIGIVIIVNILGFLLSLSKNAFGSAGLCCALFFGLSLFDIKIQKKILLPIIVFCVLLVLIITGYQVYTGNDIFATVTDRFNDTRSLQWRYSVWGYLLGHIDQDSILFGHGLTASNAELYRFLFDTTRETKGQSIFVHNAFINFLYDMGIFGMLIFTGFFAAIFNGFKRYFQTREPLFLTVVCLCLFTLICAITDECITELNASLSCWFLITLIYGLFLNTTDEDQKNLQNGPAYSVTEEVLISEA